MLLRWRGQLAYLVCKYFYWKWNTRNMFNEIQHNGLQEKRFSIWYQKVKCISRFVIKYVKRLFYQNVQQISLRIPPKYQVSFTIYIKMRTKHHTENNNIYSDAFTFLGSFFAWPPSLNPFLNRLDIVFWWRIRPVPAARRRFAFSPQLKFLILGLGYPHDEHNFFWIWKETLPQRRHVVWLFVWRLPNEVVPFV